jgi:predicted amidohydrolase YtcJ
MLRFRTSPLERLLNHLAERDRLAAPLLAKAEANKDAVLAEIFLAANGLSADDVEPASGEEGDHDDDGALKAALGRCSVPAGRGSQ